jgi:hypothetical protein
MGTRRIFSCDRCGKEWQEEKRNGYVNYPEHVDYEALKHKDLCEECYTEFYRVNSEYRNNGKNVI